MSNSGRSDHYQTERMPESIQQREGQGGSDGSGRHSAAPMLTAIMSGGVGISGRELYKYR